MTVTPVAPQVPGELHGGRPRRLHAGQQTQRPARHHPAPDLRRAHPHHLPAGEAPEADHAPPLVEGEGLASRIISLGPAGMQFLG